jgi:hypothetical protein
LPGPILVAFQSLVLFISGISSRMRIGKIGRDGMFVIRPDLDVRVSHV